MIYLFTAQAPFTPPFFTINALFQQMLRGKFIFVFYLFVFYFFNHYFTFLFLVDFEVLVWSSKQKLVMTKGRESKW